MALERSTRRLLSQARLGMLAVNTRRGPLVNPAAFSVWGDSVWMTTSRQAVKVMLARRDPRAAFLVDAGQHAVNLEGRLEIYDLRSVSGSIQAALSARSFLGGMARYSLKNAAFMAGYALDAMGIPQEWWPQNRLVLRLRVRAERVLSLVRIDSRRSARVPGPPGPVQAALGRVSMAYASWDRHGSPILTPCVWSAEGAEAAIWVPEGGLQPPASPVPAALVVELHHRFRATRMQGVCLRGTLSRDDHAAEAVAARYSGGLGPGSGHRLRVQRSSWWSGFRVTTVAVAQSAAGGAKR